MASEPSYDELVYEDRVVAFIDVLGWRNAIAGPRARPAGELGWAVHLIRQVASQAQAHRRFFSEMLIPMPGQAVAIEVSQFSDSIVISVPAGEGHHLLEMCLGQLTSLACQNKLLLRGGVVRGQIYHRDGMVYGPGLVAAYDMEQAASVPRIVLHKSLELDFIERTVMLDEQGIRYGYRKLWRRDHDGRIFFDFIQPFGAMHIFEDADQEAWQPNIQQFAQYKHLFIDGLLSNKDNFGVIHKYIWALSYFRDVLNEYPEVELQTIAVETSNGLFGFRHGEYPVEIATHSIGPSRQAAPDR